MSVNHETSEFCLCSCDGRVSKGVFEVSKTLNNFNSQNKVRYVPTSTTNSLLSFIFMAHSKKSVERVSTTELFQINGCGFNVRSNNFFYTVGADGQVIIWDIKERNKITNFGVSGPVSCACLSLNGLYLVFGIGYDWSRGVWGTNEVNYGCNVGFKIVREEDLYFKKGGGSLGNKSGQFGNNHILI